VVSLLVFPVLTDDLYYQVTYVDEKAERVSTETSYLTDEVLARPNLHVLVNTTVTRVLFDQSRKHPKAVGVEFSQGEHGTRYHARARKEVIVSCVYLHLQADTYSCHKQRWCSTFTSGNARYSHCIMLLIHGIRYSCFLVLGQRHNSRSLVSH
jgi:hypothetical protein